MKVHVQAQGYDVWYSVYGETSTDESRRYNTKSKVDQCSSTKNLWKRLHNLYSKKYASQEEEDDENKVDSQVEDYDNDDEEEAIVDMETKLTNTLCDLNK